MISCPGACKSSWRGKFDLLLGRRTYDIWAGHWPRHADNFIGKAFDKAVKYVVTRGSRPLPWNESVRMGGKALEGVIINTYRQDGSIPSLPMARIKKPVKRKG